MRWYEKLGVTALVVLVVLFAIDHLRAVSETLRETSRTNATTAASAARSAVADEKLADVHAGVLALEAAAAEASTLGSEWQATEMRHTVSTPIHEAHRLEDLQRHMAVVADAVVVTKRP